MVEVGNCLKIQKNRGWRGLAQVKITDAGKEIINNVFSFSQDMWDDMLNGHIVVQDKDYYYIITFDNLIDLPKPHQQRSVLIKNFWAAVTEVGFIEKDRWTSTNGLAYNLIVHYIKNRNNHTKSDWNNIGVRVMPEI